MGQRELVEPDPASESNRPRAVDVHANATRSDLAPIVRPPTPHLAVATQGTGVVRTSDDAGHGGQAQDAGGLVTVFAIADTELAIVVVSPAVDLAPASAAMPTTAIRRGDFPVGIANVRLRGRPSTAPRFSYSTIASPRTARVRPHAAQPRLAASTPRGAQHRDCVRHRDGPAERPRSRGAPKFHFTAPSCGS